MRGWANHERKMSHAGLTQRTSPTAREVEFVRALNDLPIGAPIVAAAAALGVGKTRSQQLTALCLDIGLLEPDGRYVRITEAGKKLIGGVE